MKPQTILLVEDSVLDATLIEQLLIRETDSFVLERTESLLSARELLARQHFDLVLLDLGLICLAYIAAASSTSASEMTSGNVGLR